MQKPTLSGKYTVVAKIDINDSQESVWELLRDFAHVENWAPSVKKSYGLGNAEPGVGAGRHCVLDGFGEIDEYITHWSEGTGFVYDVTPLGPLHKAYSRWWLTSKGNDLTELEVEFSYNLRFGLFGRVMHALIMRKKLESSLPDTVAAVKKHIEGRVADRLHTVADAG